MEKRIVLKQDLIIPKGTIFENCDGQIHQFASGMYNVLKGTGKDGTIEIFICDDVILDKPKQFEFMNE